MYHEGNRALQDAFGSRALADRLDEKLRRSRFNDDDAAFIAGLGFFFLATADGEGCVTVPRLKITAEPVSLKISAAE